MKIYVLMQRFVDYPDNPGQSPHMNLRVIQAYISKEQAQADALKFQLDGRLVVECDLIGDNQA